MDALGPASARSRGQKLHGSLHQYPLTPQAVVLGTSKRSQSDNVHDGPHSGMHEACAQEVKRLELREGHSSTTPRPPDPRAESASSLSKIPK